MSVEWFDLAQRLYAAEKMQPVPRLAHATFKPSTTAVAVRAATRGTTALVSVARDGRTEESAHDTEALALLARNGATTMGTAEPAMLLTDDAGTIPSLLALARAHAHHPDPDIAGAAAMIGWWADRADHPGTWRYWLGITDESVAGLHEWAACIATGPLLPLLDSIHDDDRYSWDRTLSAATAGHDWSRPDNSASAAMGLRTRCDAADLKAAALLSDPLWRVRALHTGRVAQGIASVAAPPTGSRRRNVSVSVTCDRLDSRMRVDSAVTGWVGSPLDQPFERFCADVTSAQVVNGKLTLGLGSVGAHAPNDGDQVTLMPQPPSPATMRAGRARYWNLYRARRSWLSTGQAPSAVRREVPLDVLIAGAEDARDH